MSRVAAIDVGTNSVRLLVADVVGGELLEHERDLTITRLGQGVDASKRLAPEPLRRTVATIAGYVERARLARAWPIRIIATSAVRDAGNRAEFVAAVARATDLEPEVLSGEAEAALGFVGATADLDAPAPVLIVDIGGGSTELVRGGPSAEAWVSLDIGSVRLTERHVRGDPPSPEELAAVRDDAARALRAAGHVTSPPPATMIGLAGTITTLSAIAQDLRAYDRAAVHHSRLDRARVRELLEQLTSMTSEQRRALPVMPAGREDVIVAGTVILGAVMDVAGVQDVMVSEADILDGAALDAAARATG